MNDDTIAPLFRSLTHGVYVVGVASGSLRNAFTAAWVMQASFAPPILAVSVNPGHSSYSLLKASQAFTLNVLASGQLELARRFGQPASVDKLASVPWHADAGGAPVLNDALAWFDCRLAGECRAGDHVIVLGRVIGGEVVQPGSEPMNYRETGDMDGSSALYPKMLEP